MSVDAVSLVKLRIPRCTGRPAEEGGRCESTYTSYISTTEEEKEIHQIELCTDDAALVVKDQASDFNALPAWGILRCLRIVESSVGSSNCDALLSVWHALAVGVEALKEQNLVRCHVFLVVEPVVVVRRYTHSLSLHLVTLS
jgi:hypothetical protein